MDLRLPTVKGIDVEQALLRMDGRINIYLRLLALFRQEYNTISINLNIAATNGNFSELQFKLHSLRGAAGNLSMYEVFAAATAIESWLLQQTAPSKQTPALIILLEQLTVCLQEVDVSISQLLAFNAS